MSKPVLISVENCARCGGDHPNLAFESFKRPVRLAGILYEHFATCPNTHQPILCATVPEDSENVQVPNEQSR